MSLIIEALKKARDDAMRRQAAARGLPLAPMPRLERRSRWLSLAVVPLAAALVICVLLLVDAYSRLPDAGGRTTAVEATPEPGSTEPDPAAGESEPTAVVGAGAPAPAVVTPPPTQPIPTESSTQPARQSSADTEPVAPRTSAEPAAQPSPQREEAPPPTAGELFTGQARLPDGQILDLGGIAWSESDPYALINGQVVGVGERIRTWRVIAIQPDQVLLEKDGAEVVLRLD